ncbi:MAG: hypothetical protein ACYC7E_05310 [Armatimonadota bacterium]
MRMACLLVVVLLPLLARADGFAFGKGFPHLQETDQAAVIHLAPDGATVDMYIGISGIPKGQSITYVLPFWHKPEGFRLEEMDGKTFQERHIQESVDRIKAEDGQADAFGSAVIGLLTGSLGVLGPYAGIYGLSLFPGFILFPTFGKLGKVSPYEVAKTPHARAEFYRVQDKDLPALVARAGLPAKYASSLKKYQTQYFAVMHLTSIAIQDGASPRRPRGIHYHFRHPMAARQGYTYTYPLGTGGAWPRPIVFIDIYITTDPDYTLQATAPIIGEEVSYRFLALMFPKYQHEDESVGPPMTATLHGDLHNPPVRYPTTWHRAYAWSNPMEDITIHVRRQPAAMAYRAANMLADVRVMMILAFLLVALAQGLAMRTVLYPHWRVADDRGSYNNMLASYLMTVIGGALVYFAFIGLGTLLCFFGLLYTVPWAKRAWDSHCAALRYPLTEALVRRTLYHAIAYYLLGALLLLAVAAWADRIIAGQ